MSSPVLEPQSIQSVESLLGDLIEVAIPNGREDLARRLASERERVGRPETVIAVVGEFKRGKSSLINGLLGADICPVDDDIATATLTVIRHGTESGVALRKEDGTLVTTGFSLTQLSDLVTEGGGAATREPSDYVEVVLNNPFLAHGVALVDTPGVGGLSAGYAGLTLGYLHAADALLFAAEAAAPLSASEVGFLKRALAVCPVVIVVLTKVDLYPDWRRVLDMNVAILEESQVSIPVVPVSAALRMAALAERDTVLNGESGYPRLLDALASQVLDPARDRARERALGELLLAVEQLAVALLTEEQALLDPGRAADTVARLQGERERLEHLRTAGARWQVVLNDEFADLVADAEHRFRQAVRVANRVADEVIEETDPAESWDELAADIRNRMAEASITVVSDLETGADGIAATITALLREEDLSLAPNAGRATPTDVAELWSARPPEMRHVMDSAATGWASLRGAQGGILVFGMLSSLAGLALTTGAMVGVGLLFGGKQLFDERKRQVTQRRQKARNGVRQFLDEVQFEVGKSMRDLSRDLQRQLRDHFTERITESVKTCVTTAEALQRSLQQDEESRRARLVQIRDEMHRLEGIYAAARRHAAEEEA